MTSFSRKAIAFINIVREEGASVFSYYGEMFGWTKRGTVYSDTPIYDQLEREWAHSHRVWR